MNNAGKVRWKQASASHKGTVDLVLCHEIRDVIGLYRPAVKDAGTLCDSISAAVCQFRTDLGVRFCGDLR